jgi:hypothetical protein
LHEKALGSTDAKVRVVSDFQRSLASAFAEVSFCRCLQTPGNTAKQKLPVRGSGFFPEYLAVLARNAPTFIWRRLSISPTKDASIRFSPFAVVNHSAVDALFGLQSKYGSAQSSRLTSPLWNPS